MEHMWRSGSIFHPVYPERVSILGLQQELSNFISINIPALHSPFNSRSCFSKNRNEKNVYFQLKVFQWLPLVLTDPKSLKPSTRFCIIYHLCRTDHSLLPESTFDLLTFLLRLPDSVRALDLSCLASFCLASRLCCKIQGCFFDLWQFIGNLDKSWMTPVSTFIESILHLPFPEPTRTVLGEQDGASPATNWKSCSIKLIKIL